MTFCRIDTPELLVDLDAMERSLRKMARFFTRLPPHYKNHKPPALARRRLDERRFKDRV
jgi:D-serine deaminase-like pyridoxal phosphate-dependent protein